MASLAITAPSRARTGRAATFGPFLTNEERHHLTQIQAAISEKQQGGYRAPQFRLFTNAIAAIQSADDAEFNHVAKYAAAAIDIAFDVSTTTPYLFHVADSASRIHPSEHRANLNAILSRLNRQEWPATEEAEALLIMKKALISAAIGAEKGAIHIARQNLGFFLQKAATLPGFKKGIKWTPALLTTLSRTVGNVYKTP